MTISSAVLATSPVTNAFRASEMYTRASNPPVASYDPNSSLRADVLMPSPSYTLTPLHLAAVLMFDLCTAS